MIQSAFQKIERYLKMFKNENLESDLIKEIDDYFKDNKDKNAIEYAKFIEESPLRQKIYQIYRELEIKHIFKFNQDFISKHFIDQRTNVFKDIMNIFNGQDFSIEKENSLQIINNLYEEILMLKQNNEHNFKHNQLGMRKVERRELWKEFSIEETNKKLKKSFNSILSKNSKHLIATCYILEEENLNILFSMDKNKYWKCIGFIFDTEYGNVFISINKNITIFINTGIEVKCLSSSDTKRAYYNDKIHSQSIFTQFLPCEDIKGYHYNSIEETYKEIGEKHNNILISEKKKDDKYDIIEFKNEREIIFKHYSYLNNENRYWALSKYNERNFLSYFSEEYYHDIDTFFYNSNSSFVNFSNQINNIVRSSFSESSFDKEINSFDFIFKTNLIDRFDEFEEILELNTSN